MRRKIVLILFFVLIVILTITYKDNLSKKEIKIDIPYGTDAMWERILDEPGVLEIPGSSRAVVLPHHLITSLELTKFFRKLSNDFQPKTIILVGPNHYEEGKANIQTCNCTYNTIKGELNTDSIILNDVLNNNLAKYNSKPFKKEHSIYSHAMFIKNFFPESKIIPFILKVDTLDQEVDQLAEYISSLNNILIVASVDFSHYISHTAADFHDEFSFNSINNFDYERIKKAEVDSPASLRFVTKWSEKNGYNNVSLVRHTNSQDFFRQQKLDLTTSHLFISFSEGEKEIIPQVNIHFFGDSMFDRSIKEIMNSEDILSTIAMEEKRFFRGNDYNILNLEGTFDGDKAQDKEIIFNFNSEKVLPVLQEYNFNSINLANNHSFDYFLDGYNNTVSILNKNNIDSFGGYNLNNTCKSSIKDNLKIAFCGLNDVRKVLSIDESLKIISDISKNHDITLLNIHWGEEYSNTITNRQRNLAYQFIDSGVDLIIGHHPHVIQPLEIYKNKVIFYSLGNFIFDQEFPEETKQGLSVGSSIFKDKIILYLLPFHTNIGKPSIFNYEENIEFLNNFLKGKEEYTTNIPGKIIINN